MLQGGSSNITEPDLTQEDNLNFLSATIYSDFLSWLAPVLTRE